MPAIDRAIDALQSYRNRTTNDVDHLRVRYVNSLPFVPYSVHTATLFDLPELWSGWNTAERVAWATVKWNSLLKPITPL